MNNIAIRVENLSKQYQIGSLNGKRPFGYHSLRDTITDAFSSPFRRAKALLSGQAYGASEMNEMIWALKDVSFEVKRGEVVGIIGRNGAGKSTLLKILSRITEPTEGQVTIYGRIGSLLEVGTGFHPELTGRENIYLNGAILGMRRIDIQRQFDEIVAFAEVEKFIDTPVKHYSSGMYLRLAFAVAAHLEPEILLVDEVLAVGDAQFQKKCLGKMGDVAEEGRTVLFVSHNMAAIRALCQQGILLANGQIRLWGTIEACMMSYLAQDVEAEEKISDRISYLHPDLQITEITVNGSSSNHLELESDIDFLRIEIIGHSKHPIKMEIEAVISDLYENPLGFFSRTHERGKITSYPAGDFQMVRQISLPKIMRGQYYLNLYLSHPDVQAWITIPRAVTLFFEGMRSATGQIFDYYKDKRGWIYLPEKLNNHEEN